jgi:hypothetical protein
MAHFCHHTDWLRDRSCTTVVDMLQPPVLPCPARLNSNAAMRSCYCVSHSATDVSPPIRRVRWPCCARAATGHAAALPRPTILPPSHLRPPEISREAYRHLGRIGTGADGSSWPESEATAIRRRGRFLRSTRRRSPRSPATGFDQTDRRAIRIRGTGVTEHQG